MKEQKIYTVVAQNPSPSFHSYHFFCPWCQILQQYPQDFWSKYFTYFVPLWMCFELLSIQCFGSRLQIPPKGGEGGWRKTCGNDPLFRLSFVQTSTSATTKISLSTTTTTNSCPRSLSSQIPPEELSWPLEAFQWKAAGNDFLANMYSAYFSVVCYHAPLHNFSFLPYSFSFFPPFWYFPPNFFSSSPIPSLSLSFTSRLRIPPALPMRGEWKGQPVIIPLISWKSLLLFSMGSFLQ